MKQWCSVHGGLCPWSSVHGGLRPWCSVHRGLCPWRALSMAGSPLLVLQLLDRWTLSFLSLSRSGGTRVAMWQRWPLWCLPFVGDVCLSPREPDSLDQTCVLHDAFPVACPH